MSKLLKNTTNADILISEVGVTIPSNFTYTAQPSDALLWAGSDELVVHLGTGDLVGNDGTKDLTPTESVKLFQGLYPSKVVIQDATFTNGAMDVNATVSTGTTTVPSTINSELTNNNVTLNKSIDGYTSLYSYTGTGHLYAFKIKFNSANVITNLTIDGNILFEIDCSDLEELFQTDSNNVSTNAFLKWDKFTQVLTYEPLHPIKIDVSVLFQAKANSGSSNKVMEVCLATINKVI